MNKVTLEDFIEEISMGPFGSDITVDNYKSSGVPVLNGSNLTSHKLVEDSFNYVTHEKARSLGKANAGRGDIVITHRGTLGQVSYIPKNSKFDNYIISQSQFRVRFNKEINPVYFSYLMKTDYGQRKLLSFKNHVGVPALAQATTNFRALDMNILDIEMQRKIAVVLSAFDDKIELNSKINAELEQMARTLYDYWFVQFDFPDANGKPYKSSGGQMAYNDQLKREIPEGWQVQSMLENDLFEVIKPRIDDFNGEKQYIATADVNGLNISDGSPITYENRESRANMQPKAFTVWFAKMKNSIKHVLVGDYSDDLIEKTIFSTGFMGLQTKREAFEYVALTVHRPYFELVKDSNSSGATMEAIGNSAMANMKLIIPDDRTLKMFYEVARPLLEKIDKNRQESQNLAHLRDWLLPMLMNGQVSVE